MNTERGWAWKKFGVMVFILTSLATLGCMGDPPDFVIVDKDTVTGVVAGKPRVISIINEDLTNGGGTIIDSFFKSLYTDVESAGNGRIIVCEIPLRVEGEGFFLLQAGPHNPFREQHLKECAEAKRGTRISVEVEKRYFWDGTGPFQKTVRLQHEESTL